MINYSQTNYRDTYNLMINLIILFNYLENLFIKIDCFTDHNKSTKFQYFSFKILRLVFKCRHSILIDQSISIIINLFLIFSISFITKFFTKQSN